MIIKKGSFNVAFLKFNHGFLISERKQNGVSFNLRFMNFGTKGKGL